MRQQRARLAAQRKAAGFTQEALAFALGVDRTTVARWESGGTEPQPWLRRKLARMLGITPEQLSVLLGEYPVDRLTSPSRVRSGRIDPVAVRSLSAQVADIATRYETEPSAALVAEAGQAHATLSFLLAQGGSDRARQQLHQVATTSAALLSQLVWDASGRRDGAAAANYCDTAIDHATACADTVAVAHAELRKAYVALYGLADRRNPQTGLNVNIQSRASCLVRGPGRGDCRCCVGVSITV